MSEDYYTAQANLTGALFTGAVKHNILIGTDAERYLNATNAFSFTSLYDKSIFWMKPNSCPAPINL